MSQPAAGESAASAASLESGDTEQLQSSGASLPAGQWLRWLAVALCAVGWWLSVNLLQIGGGATPTPLMQRLCGEADADGGAFDCQSVLRSRLAYLRSPDDGGGPATPWSAVGAAYFSFVGLWWLLVGPVSRRRAAWHAALLTFMGFGLVISLQLTYWMAFDLKRWCLGCVLVHVINAALFLITLLGFPWKKPSSHGRGGAAADIGRPYPALSHAVAAFVAAAGIAYGHLAVTRALMLDASLRTMVAHYEQIVKDPQFARWSYQRQPAVTIPERDSAYQLGPGDARHTIVAFFDAKCDACRLAHQHIAALQRRHPDLLRVVFRHYPLDGRCNPHAARTAHPGACRAAAALEAVNELGGAEAYARLVEHFIASPATLDGDNLASWAEYLGIDPAGLEAIAVEPSTAERIEADIAAARSLGVQSVPVIFVDGRRFEHWRSPASWYAVLDLPPPAEDSPMGAAAEP